MKIVIHPETIKLEFFKEYKSIRHMAPVELPLLTILVGINGIGKTHILEAINQNYIKESITGRYDIGEIKQIKYMSNNANNFDNNMTYSSNDNLAKLWNNITKDFMEIKSEKIRGIIEPLEIKNGKLIHDSFPHRKNWDFTIDEIVSGLQLKDDFKEVLISFRNAETELQNEVALSRSSVTNANPRQLAISTALNLAHRLRIGILEVTEERLNAFTAWGTYDPFEINIAFVLGAYRDAQLSNWMFQKMDEREQTTFALTDEAFKEKFGNPPWETVDEHFRKLDIPFRVKKPDLYNFSPYSFRLVKENSDVELYVNELSSGEKIVVRFALSIFDPMDIGHNLFLPQLLLLDEMDASLHPEMLRRWLSMISKIVQDLRIPCILTTHSPTTVALAPEESLFEVAEGGAVIRKISKQQALNQLTVGVPTLAIDYNVQRIVFVESDTDAQIYTELYTSIKSYLRDASSLVFLSTGTKTKDHMEINTGCSIVTSLVERLRNSGNKTCFGVVDWDGANNSSDRIKVIAEGTRNAIENVILDPLLLASYLIKHRDKSIVSLAEKSFFSLKEINETSAQELVDLVEKHLDIKLASAPRLKVKTVGGTSYEIASVMGSMDDHELEDIVKSRIPSLRRFQKRGKLCMEIVNHVVRELPELCPSEIAFLFDEISAEPLH